VMGPLEDQIEGGKHRTVSSMHASTIYGATACFTRNSELDAGKSGAVRMRLMVFSGIL
jgi:hypothetical protein